MDQKSKSTLTEGELLQTIQEMSGRIDVMQAEMDANSKKQIEGVPRSVDEMARQSSTKEVKAFLDTPLAKSTFFTFNPFHRLYLWPDGAFTDASQIKRHIPFLKMEFSRWRGPGTEFPNPLHPNRTIPFGICHMHRVDIVGVTEVEIEKYGIDLSDLRNKVRDGYHLNNEPHYSLTRVMDRILRHEELGVKFYTAVHFQEIVRSMYEGKWEEAKRAERLNAYLAEMREGREKTGHVDDPELLVPVAV